MTPRAIQAEIDKCRDKHTGLGIATEKGAFFVIRFTPKGEGKEFHGVNFLKPDTAIGHTYESIDERHIATVLAPLHPTKEEIDERLFMGDLGGGMMFCDPSVEKNGDFLRWAFLPRKVNEIGYDRLGFYWERNQDLIPMWIKNEIRRQVDLIVAEGNRKQAEHEQAVAAERATRKAMGYPGY